jgi:hypothetical protein
METREILLKADKVSVVFERIEGGKIRATTSSWDDAKVLLDRYSGCSGDFVLVLRRCYAAALRPTAWTSASRSLMTRW